MRSHKGVSRVSRSARQSRFCWLPADRPRKALRRRQRPVTRPRLRQHDRQRHHCWRNRQRQRPGRHRRQHYRLDGRAADRFCGPTWGQGIVNGAKARFDQVNAQGGIDGRQLKLVTEDDQSSPAQNLSAVQSLIQDQHSFAILGTSSFMFGGYKICIRLASPLLAPASMVPSGTSSPTRIW